ncbi:MAG: nickel-responsive transcriptional regulator NikR [archaeon]
MEGKVKRISVSVPEELLKEFDELTTKKAYISRSKAIGDAIRSYIANYRWSEEKKAGIGTISILYDHTIRGVTEKIVEVQHSFHSLISSNTHLHLDGKNCLEIIIVKSNPKKINELASKLQVLRGVKQAKLVTITP